MTSLRFNTENNRKLYARDKAAWEAANWPLPLCRNFDLEALELVEDVARHHRLFKDFRSYQKWMTRLIIENPAVYLAAEMGLGKTAATLKAMRQLLDMRIVKKVLVVAPLKVADLTWPEEIATWDFSRSMTYACVTGDETDRLIALREWGDVEVHIINRENLVWLQKYWGYKWPYDMLVYDEASRLKGGDTLTKGNLKADGTMSPRRMSEFGALARMRHKFKKVCLLSGTPAPNGLIDLFGPIFILDGGVRLMDSMNKFQQRWFSYNPYTRERKPHEWSYDEIMDRIGDVFFSLKEKDYLQVPPTVEVDHWVDLPPAMMAKYRQLQRDMVLEEFDVEAVNNGVLTNKLLQFANGSLYNSESEAIRLHDHKLDVLDSIVTEASGRPVLLGYQFQFDRDAIRKRFPYARFFGEGKDDKKDWDNGKIKLLVTHPASAGHGLNLQFGGNIQVWFGLTWSLELYQQFVKRLARSGQLADRVFLHRILAKGTVDESMVKTLARKGVTQDNITDAVKADVVRDLRMAA